MFNNFISTSSFFRCYIATPPSLLFHKLIDLIIKEEPPDIVDHPDLLELDIYSEEQTSNSEKHSAYGLRHMCDICGKYFKQKSSLTTHQQRRHWEALGIPLVKYGCTICNNHYLTPTGLKRHNMRIHNPNVDFSVPCDICGERLSNKNTLRSHKSKHKGYKQHVCDICSKTFLKREQLKVHMRVHTGEKPYKCRFCGRRFTQMSPMKAHERIHTGERPYICKTCGADFITKGVMDHHIKTCNRLKGNQKKQRSIELL
ncbi:hypothetical protein JTB14_006888 [Gonioctena quinquepunctata]|nr:hypothetical protein JTB14_006888 [Gonioctena quinquepunctata]